MGYNDPGSLVQAGSAIGVVAFLMVAVLVAGTTIFFRKKFSKR